VPLEIAIGRLLDGRDGFKFYEAGMDLGLSDDPEESFRLFRGRILEQYEKMVGEFGLTVIDATLPIETQQFEVRKIVEAQLENGGELRFPR
jgi:dTMP kinase